MITNVIKVSRCLTGILIVLVTLIACEKDIENIGTGLVDNDNFSTNNLTTEVIAYNQNIVKRKAQKLGQYLLGIHKDQDFGKIEASIVTQLSLPIEGAVDFGINPTIDSVIVDIPYQSTKNASNYTNGTPRFDLDSIIGDPQVAFKLEIFELGTFLSSLDPSNPTQIAEYYTDDAYIEGPLLYSGNFKPNSKDTVAYISRKFDLITPSVIYKIDTVKRVNISPSIKIPLNTSLIQSKFITGPVGSELSSNDAFKQYFRGLYIKATPDLNDKASLLSLNMSAAKMTIYYSEEITVDEEDSEDLNYNNISGEAGVIIKDPKSYAFSFGTIQTNTITRDYSGSDIESLIASPDMVNGEEKIYIQGAVGSEAVLELFKNEDISQLRANNWLINEANIYLYKDPSAENSATPIDLYLYNYNDNSQLVDVMRGEVIGGTIALDDDGNALDYYKFRITDFISEVLKAGSTDAVPRLGLKVFNPTDLPLSPVDTIIKDYNWNPKGVVLKGNLPITDDKRIKLEIFYSEINN